MAQTPTRFPTSVFAALLLALLPALPAVAADLPERIPGIVSAVEDGDTLTLQADDGRCIVVRMSDYDAPETPHAPGEPSACGGAASSWPPEAFPGQPGGRAAGDALRGLALGRRAVADCHGPGGYGRLACHVTVEGEDESLNRRMIRAGWGWVFTRPDWVRDPESYRIEGAVRADGTGWRGDPAAIEPYRWRRDCWNRGKGPARPEKCPGADYGAED